MTEMTRRERILRASYKERADKLPFFHNWRHLQTGWAERECRNRGMGISWARPSYVVKIHDVDITEQRLEVDGQTVYRRTYSTPLGSVYLDERREPGTGEWHGMRSWRDVTPWQTERLIKGPEDYPVVKYIVEHTEYVPDYFPIEQAKDWLGEEGIVMDIHPHQPMQTLMIDWIGSEGGRFFIHHAKYPDLVEDLCQAIAKSREPLYEIAAKSPADIIWCGDNIDGVLVNPRLFEKYFMPEYEKMAKVFHEHGKLLAVHMDGRVGVLKDLIARTPIDIIEALHPPPMGDLPIGEALSLWQDKVIWVGFPGSVYSLGPEATKKHALNLLREVVPGERLCIAMSTENIVSNENLLMLTSVLEKAELPLTQEKIDQIERSLA
ncbi:MAG TPA: hypothetical protein G4O01_00500 [Dehalococcoidia bacterium]|jgi:hypothetical protein|nr:hypothetical protein [Dehalococcoidia bacterium]